MLFKEFGVHFYNYQRDRPTGWLEKASDIVKSCGGLRIESGVGWLVPWVHRLLPIVMGNVNNKRNGIEVDPLFARLSDCSCLGS